MLSGIQASSHMPKSLSVSKISQKLTNGIRLDFQQVLIRFTSKN